jgi:nucleotide-binding universal stress UspA family protein
MYTRLLIALDGSRLAEQVLPYARFLARALALPIDLIHAVDPEAIALLTDPEHNRYADTVWGDKVNNGRTYLETVAHSFRGADVQCRVEKGRAEDVIIDKAAADKNTLIVLATHGRSGIQRWLLGSVADKVVHGASNHVFLIRADEQGDTSGEAPLKTVIVPLDGSALAEQVLPYAIALAKSAGLKLVLMRAYALPPSATGEEYGIYTEELVKQIENEASEYLQKKLEEAKRQGVGDVESVVKFGYGATEIIALAHGTPASFVAMCTHGRSGINRWVLGSVTERVVRHSGDPVLIIRAL